MNSLSPCIGNCKLDDLDVCLGCKRTIEEISLWPKLNDTQKQRIINRLKSDSQKPPRSA